MDDDSSPATRKRRAIAKAVHAKSNDASVIATEYGLTAKQAAFVDAKANGKSSMVAVRAAGYSDPVYRVHSLDQNPKINEAIVAERAKNAAFLGYTRRDVLEGISEAIEQARTLADPMAQIAGWREVAKICGYYAPEVKKIELTGAHRRKLNEMEQMSDEELLSLALQPALEVEFSEVKGQDSH